VKGKKIMPVLEGKVAVITGGTRGLGLSIARTLVNSGASVVIASMTPASVETAVNKLKEEGFTVSGMVVDVADLEQVQALASQAIALYGRLDIWINNAGIAGPYGPTVELAPQDFYRIVNTNILGVYNGSMTAMAGFMAQRSGKLINLLGQGYKGPVRWQNAYASSKIWVRSFTKALAEETRGTGVDVLAFNPGMVMTDLLTNLDVVEGSEDRLKVYPTILRMWAKPPEIPAGKVAWMASAATDGQTGKLISLSSFGSILLGAAREGLRALFHKPSREIKVKIHSIPPHKW
jgi:glucose 1-dehydrogenase